MTEARKLNIINNLVDFLPSGSFALYKSLETIIDMPANSIDCNSTQRLYLALTFGVCAIFVFFTSLYPTEPEHPGNTTSTLRERLTQKFLLPRSILAVIAFAGLVLPMTDVTGCLFHSYNDTVSRVTPLLLAVICTVAEQAMTGA